MIPLVDDALLARAMRVSEQAGAKAAWQELRPRLGRLGALRVLIDVALRQARGEPFRHLGPPTDARDRLSRRQAGSAVLLWRALRSRVGETEARVLTRAVVQRAGIAFLAPQLGDLRGEVDPADLRHRAGRFFNAEGDFEDQPSGVLFRVQRCRFPALLEAADAATLAPLFCEVDEAYFRPAYTPIRLRRSRTLATGGPDCDFHFDWS